MKRRKRRAPGQCPDTPLAQAVTDINTTLATIRTKLPFLISLTEEERKTMAKGGSKSQGIIQNSLTFAAPNPNAFPADFDLAEYAKDGALHDPLQTVLTAIAKLNEDTDDTFMVLNSELYLQSIRPYAFARVKNRKGQYDSHINLVKPFFTHPRQETTPTPPAPNP